MKLCINMKVASSNSALELPFREVPYSSSSVRGRKAVCPASLFEERLETVLVVLEDLPLVAETWARIMSSVGMTWSPTGASMSGGLDVSCACLALVWGGGMYVLGGRSSRKVDEDSGIV